MSNNIKIYTIKSESNPKIKYTVRHFNLTNKWVCDCPFYTFGKIGTICKHIKKAKKIKT